MFCRWCGEKIEDNGHPCPHCGKEQGSLINGNAFFDLCEPELTNDNQHGASEEDKSTSKSATSRINKGESKRKPHVFSIVSIMLSVLTILGICFVMCILNGHSKSIAAISYTISNAQQSINSNISEMDSQMRMYIEQYSEDLESRSTDSDIIESETNTLESDSDSDIVSDDIEENIFTNLEKTDSLTIECYQVDDMQNTLVYVAEGEIAEDEAASFYWQSSADNGGTWELIAENERYIIGEGDYTNYRVICRKEEIQTINLDDNDFAESITFAEISKHIIEGPEDTYLYHAEIVPTAIEFANLAWQYSSDNEEWTTLSQNEYFMLSADRSGEYRLMITVSVSYFAEYQANLSNG